MNRYYCAFCGTRIVEDRQHDGRVELRCETCDAVWLIRYNEERQ